MNIQEFRQQFPEYDGRSDQELADALYQKHYTHVDRNLFDQKFLGGVAPQFDYQQAPLDQPQEHIPAPQAPQMSDPTSESLAMFNPQSIGNEMVNYAPEIGLMAGGLMGAGPMSVPMAGMGYAAGQMVKQGIQGRPQLGAMPQQAQEFPDLMSIPTMGETQDFGKGAFYELTGKGFGAATSGAIKGVSWLSRKGGEKIAEGLQALVNPTAKLAKEGMPLPPLTEAGQQAAKKAAGSWPGNVVVKEAHEKLRTGVNEMLGEFKTTYGVNKFTKEATDKAFNDWAEMLGGNEAYLELPRSRAYIEETLRTKLNKEKFWNTQAESLLDNSTVRGVRDIWQTIGKGKPIGVDQTSRNKLGDIIERELREYYGDEAAQLLTAAKNQNAWLKKSRKLRGIINGSYDRKAGTELFMPDRFARLWEQNRYQPTTFKHFSQKELAEIDEFADLMKAVGHELSRNVSDKGFGMWEATTALGALGTGALSSPEKAAIPIALGAIPPALSYRASRVYNPQSWAYQKALGNVGQAREMLPGLVNIGGKLIMMKKEDIENYLGGGW